MSSEPVTRSSGRIKYWMAAAVGMGLFSGAMALGWHFSQLGDTTQSAFEPAANTSSLRLVEAGPPADMIVSYDQRSFFPTDNSRTVTTRLRRGGTLVGALTKAGADRGQAYNAIQTLFDGGYLDARRLQAGMPIKAHLSSTGDLTSLSINQASDTSLLVKRRTDGAYLPIKLEAKLRPQTYRISSSIETSLYEAILKEGGKDQQVADIAQIFAFDVDFQREIHPGDQFEIVYNAMVDERGQPIRGGDMLYASINGRIVNKAYYQHTPSDDDVSDYFTRKGEAATRFLMKTPINGARLSSSFGRRRHPISGYTRLHKGTDFAAPRGTPIYAAGHGTVERASRYGGYGNYVRIRHANGYKTAYAHMRGYGPGVKKGKRVRQGDIIGYVGSTGASTGPHLHYEVLINGKHVNAMQLKLPTGRKLTGDLYTEFAERRDEIDAMRISLGAEIGTQIPASRIAPR